MSYQKLNNNSKDHVVASGKAINLKYASLITLTVQNAALNITMRMARTQNDLFIASTAVIIAEVIKIISCLAMVLHDEGSVSKVVKSLKTHIADKPLDTLKVAVPSIINYVQNNLIYIGATHLDAATAQVTYQLKILTTAIFSVTMLRKHLVAKQWFALLFLFVGVAMVQLVNSKGFFFGYTFITWVVVLLQAQGGLLVAVVVKYADNILKGFATSLSIILSCIISVYFFQFHLSIQFVLGAAFVISSIFLYSQPTSSKPILPESNKPI